MDQGAEHQSSLALTDVTAVRKGSPLYWSWCSLQSTKGLNGYTLCRPVITSNVAAQQTPFHLKSVQSFHPPHLHTSPMCLGNKTIITLLPLDDRFCFDPRHDQPIPTCQSRQTLGAVRVREVHLEAVEGGVGAKHQLLVVLQRVDVTVGNQHGAKSLGLCQ